MNCPECHFKNPEGANFCYECGHNFPLTSKATSQVISFDEKLANIQRYLPQGITEKILSQKEKLEGERRQVTVMFCDMEGFTPLVDMLGTEEAYRFMDQVYEILIYSVHDFGGTVNEMTGDGIMALFGAPIALEDAPQRALRSAISIHHDMVSFSAQNKGIGSIRMRIGIHTGPVIVGTLGNNLRVEFKAVGNTVNLASRMETLAEAGSTYVTEETFKQTKELFRFETVGKKSVKGKKESILVYKVLSAKKDVYRPRLGSERMIYSKLVGRDKEIDQLELQVMKVINGEGSVINLIGEAGIGKSRLVAELKKHEVLKRVTLFEGRAISIGRNLNFHPIIDLLKQWARIRENDGEAMALGKLEAAVKSLYPEEYAEVLPFVATLMGMKLSGKNAERVRSIEGEALENLILKNLRELLIKATQQTPLVIVLEDLHWADTSSIELVESLFRLAETQRILFINVFRPGHKATGERIVETVKERLPVYYVEIVLEPLDKEMSEALVTNMLKISGIHHPVIGQMLERAGGNPFFIEEVVRSFIDEGAVVLRDGTFETTQRIRTLAIPHTINEVLMARIDRLDDDTRYLVKVASVIGRNFFYRILAGVADTIKDIDRKLFHLKEVQLIRERQRMEELEYLFKHALAQEAAYESILAPKRKELHLKVAASIERVFSERLHEFYGMLAYHYSKAENHEKAEEYLIKAGEEALKSSASSEALHYYREALGIYLKMYGDEADPEKVAMFDKNIALALYNRGRYEEAVEYFDKALNYYWGELPKRLISTIPMFSSAFLHFLITLYIPFLKFKYTPTQMDIEIIDLFYKKCEALTIIDPKRFFFEFLYIFKQLTKFDLNKIELGLKIYMGTSALFSFTGFSFKLSNKVLESAKARIYKDDAKMLITYDLLETIHNYLRGNWKGINKYDDNLADKNLSLGGIYDASQHYYWHGFPYIYQGSFHIAKLIVNRLNDIYDVYENNFSLLLKYELNTNLLIERRCLHDALTEVEAGLGIRKSQGLPYYLELYSCKVWIHLLMKDIEKAEEILQHANQIRLEANTVPIELSSFCRSQLEFDLYHLNESIKSGNRFESAKYRKKANKSSKALLKVSQKAARYRTESYKLMGVYYWLINKQKEALKWWNKAIEEGERLGACLELSRSYFEIGKCLLETESKYKMLNRIKAEEYLKKAKVLFEEMNLKWDLDELSRVVQEQGVVV